MSCSGTFTNSLDTHISSALMCSCEAFLCFIKIPPSYPAIRPAVMCFRVYVLLRLENKQQLGGKQVFNNQSVFFGFSRNAEQYKNAFSCTERSEEFSVDFNFFNDGPLKMLEHWSKNVRRKPQDWKCEKFFLLLFFFLLAMMIKRPIWI